MGAMPTAPQMGPYFVVFDGHGRPTLVTVIPGGGLVPIATAGPGLPTTGRLDSLVAGGPVALGGQLSPTIPASGVPVPTSDYPALANQPGGLGVDAGSGIPGPGGGLVGGLITTPEAMTLDNLAGLYSSVLGARQSIASGQGAVANPVVQQVQRKPWLDPPDGSRSIDATNALTIAAVGSGTTLVAYQVPEGRDGVITAYSWNYIPSSGAGDSFTDGSGNISVSLYKNSTPVPNYTNITVQKGCVSIARPISPIRVYSTQVIAIIYAHLSNASLLGTVIGTLEGYDYPSQG